MKKKFPIVVIFFIVGIFLAGTISYIAISEASRNKKIETEVADLKKQALQIENENNVISQKIEYYQTPEFQEKIAKEKLNMQKPDENVAIIKPSVEKQIVDQNSKVLSLAVNISDQPNYVKWWNFFFKL